MQKKHKLIGLGVLGAILLIFVFNVAFYTPENFEKQNFTQHESIPKSSVVWYLSPFTIDGNGLEGMTWAEAVLELGLSGDGSIGEPYVIKNLVIDASDGGSGIRIVNSEAYFKIENCTIYNAPPPNAGIWFSHVSNGIILDSNCSFNWQGITLDPHCENNIIRENIINKNQDFGINILESNYNYIKENTANSNGVMGINLDPSSSYNNISDNTVNFNGWLGIHMQADSRYNLVLSNNCSYNGEGIAVRSPYNIISGNHIEYNGLGIHLWGSDSGANTESNSITGNFIYNNEAFGIVLESSHNNQIVSNDVYNNYRGIYLIESTNNNITQNIVSNQRLGIATLFDSDNNYVKNNEVYGCVFGIHTNYNSDGTQVIGNIVYQNFLGMSIYQTSEYNVSKNIITNNDYGIWGWLCYDSDIMDNNFLNNNDAITLEECSNVNVSLNIIKYSLNTGIHLLISSEITVLENLVDSSGKYGIYLLSSSYNQIRGNIVKNNVDSGICLEESDNNLIEFNTIKSNGGSGMICTTSSNILIHVNDIKSNSGNGIYLIDTRDFEIWENKVTNNYWGIENGGGNFNGAIYNNTLKKNTFPISPVWDFTVEIYDNKYK